MFGRWFGGIVIAALLTVIAQALHLPLPDGDLGLGLFAVVVCIAALGIWFYDTSHGG